VERNVASGKHFLCTYYACSLFHSQHLRSYVLVGQIELTGRLILSAVMYTVAE